MGNRFIVHLKLFFDIRKSQYFGIYKTIHMSQLIEDKHLSLYTRSELPSKQNKHKLCMFEITDQAYKSAEACQNQQSHVCTVKVQTNLNICQSDQSLLSTGRNVWA